MRKKKFILVIVLFFLIIIKGRDVEADDMQVHCVDNELMHKYMDEVQYKDSDYTYSMIEEYIKTKALSSTPNPLKIDIPYEDGTVAYKIIYADNEVFRNSKVKVFSKYRETYELYNLIPDRTYYIKVISINNEGSEKVIVRETVNTTGLVYALKIEGTYNVRDIGHKNTILGLKVIEGRIFRGGSLNKLSYSGLYEMVYNEGITVEIDFRDNKELGLNTVKTDDDYVPKFYEYYNYQIGGFSKIKNGDAVEYAKVFRRILRCLMENKNIYIHCVAGADRTGAMSAILEGVLGVSENDIAKDYELTTFSKNPRIRYYDTNYLSSNNYFPEAIAKIKTYPGERMCDKWAAFLKTGGVTDAEIDEFRRIMIIEQ